MFSASAAQVGSSTLYVDDVFSTYLYTGNGSTQTITNGIDLSTNGGLVWIKTRNTVQYHTLFTSATGFLRSNTTDGNTATTSEVTSFNSNGFSLGAGGAVNSAGLNEIYASWTFRKAPKFFDVVTYTGTGVFGQSVSHSLGVVPAVILIKRTDSTGNWLGYWRKDATQGVNGFSLNTTNAVLGNVNTTDVATATTFQPVQVQDYLGNGANAAGTYVAYLFAHDTATDGIIQCGSYTGNGSATGPVVTLGWEPQFIIARSATTAGGANWYMLDTMRGIATGGNDAYVYSNLANAEGSAEVLEVNATGFQLKVAGAGINDSGQTHIYLAIRRPNKPPTTGTQVYNAIARTGTGAAATVTGVGFAPDMFITKGRFASDTELLDRLRGNAIQVVDGAGADQTVVGQFDSTVFSTTMDGMRVQSVWNTNAASYIDWFFRRAPGFMDEVCFTGTGTTNNPAHNLGVVPELIIAKNRTADTGGNWGVAVLTSSPPYKLSLNLTSAGTDATGWFTATSSTFNTANICTNNSGVQFVTYLFATLPGISKVFSYTGNGSSQTINCGFTGGARFVLIKRTDSTGDWLCWDATRGIVAANDPHLSLNTTAAEVTTDDSVDTDSTGFIVNQVAATNVNVNAATYIGLAIA